MGTWITHLRIAENLLAILPGLDEVAFVYGNLAPDSGLPNDDWTVFDPPKEVTHFLEHSEGEDAIRDYIFYEKYLSPADPIGDRETYSFRLGYFFHLIGDILWAKKIGTTTLKAFALEIQADPGRAWELIKRDWYDLDLLFVQQHPDCIFWRVMAATPNPSAHLPFIPNTAFHHQMDYIRRLYSQPSAEWLASLSRPYPYLNEKTMSRIVEESTTIILYIWHNRNQLENKDATQSTLDLVNESELLPYDMPLGNGEG